MTIEVKRPARLDIKDMPRDTTRALGGLRQALCASFNYCRSYPKKMAILKAVLKYTYNRVVAWEKETEAAQENADKNKLEALGRLAGIELDRRKSINSMQKDLDKYKAKSDEEKAEENAEEARKAKAEALTKRRLEAAENLKKAEQTVKDLEPVEGDTK